MVEKQAMRQIQEKHGLQIFRELGKEGSRHHTDGMGTPGRLIPLGHPIWGRLDFSGMGFRFCFKTYHLPRCPKDIMTSSWVE